MALDIKHGAFSRVSFPVNASETTLWKKGRILCMSSTGWIVATGSASRGYGVALEDRVGTSSIGPTVTLTKVNAPSGEKRSAFMDYAVITTDQLQSGVTFNTNDAVYVSTTGYFTTSGNGTGANNPVVGVSMGSSTGITEPAIAGDGARQLVVSWNGNLG